MKHTHLALAIIGAISITACGHSNLGSADNTTTTDNSSSHLTDGLYGNTGEGSTGEGSTGEGSTGEGSTGEGSTGEGSTVGGFDGSSVSGIGGNNNPTLGEPEIDNSSKKQAEGKGSVIINYDGKFATPNAMNPSLKDGKRKDYNAQWDEFSFQAPSTIIGNDSEVEEALVLDIKAAEKETQTATVKLTNGQKIDFNYDADITYLGNENDKYIAQAVHIFGNSGAYYSDDSQLNIAYVYGKIAPKSLGGTDKDPKGKDEPFTDIFKYEGKATYAKDSDIANQNYRVYKGTSSFDVAFDSENPEIRNGVLEFAQLGKTLNVPSMSFSGGKSTFEQDFQTAGYKGSNYERNDVPVNTAQARGYFYGDNAQAIGGTFYDNEGIGTFFAEQGNKIED